VPDLQHVEVNGVRLAYDDFGEGPAILFIHGFMLDRTMWRGQVAALDGWRRIAPDLRGHGLSEAPERDYSMAAYADDLATMLDGRVATGARRQDQRRTLGRGLACDEPARPHGSQPAYPCRTLSGPSLSFNLCLN
jgi:alpha-beta hydrolase superfamily lysophospholipase